MDKKVEAVKIVCPYCKSCNVGKNGFNLHRQYYLCKKCSKNFTKSSNAYLAIIEKQDTITQRQKELWLLFNKSISTIQPEQPYRQWY